MAISVVNKKQTIKTANASLAITSATAANTLVALISQTATTTPPTVSDNLSGTWKVSETFAKGTSSNRTYVATKTAVGGETEIKVTPGSGGTVQGIGYVEASGANLNGLEVVHRDEIASNTIAKMPAVTCEAGSLVVMGMGDGAGSSGTPIEWKREGGGSPVPTTCANEAEQENSRMSTGYIVASGALSGQVYELAWATAKASQTLAIILKPAPSVALGLSLAVTPTVVGEVGRKVNVAIATALALAVTGTKAATSPPITMALAPTGAVTGIGEHAGSVGLSLALAATSTGTVARKGSVSIPLGVSGAPTGGKQVAGSITGSLGLSLNVGGFGLVFLSPLLEPAYSGANVGLANEQANAVPFVAGKSGLVRRYKLKGNSNTGAPRVLEVAICEDEGGKPGAVIAVGSHPFLDENVTFQSVDLSPVILGGLIVAGHTYWEVLRVTGGGSGIKVRAEGAGSLAIEWTATKGAKKIAELVPSDWKSGVAPGDANGRYNGVVMGQVTPQGAVALHLPIKATIAALREGKSSAALALALTGDLVGVALGRVKLKMLLAPKGKAEGERYVEQPSGTPGAPRVLVGQVGRMGDR